MPGTFYTGMPGPLAVAKLDQLWDSASTVLTLGDYYLGPKSSAPTTNNSGGVLLAGVSYWNSTSSEYFIYNGTSWVAPATQASTSATSAATSYDSFDDRYLGPKATAPTLDNDGAALLTGAMYWNTATSRLLYWTGSAWSDPVTTAATSATNAASSATAAATSATNAATSATNAANSATSASTSASTATTQATNASTSATNAANSATSASTSASTATTQATNAATSATNAATSATNAANSYTTFNNSFLGSKTTDPTLNNSGGALVTGNIYWNSTTPEMRVYNGTSWVAVQSTTAATNAANSATAAATSATNAATSATNANSSFLSIDKKYLGSKASAPTLDNQGAALATGALYWNSTTNRLLMWTGSAWSDPVTTAATSATNAATSATNAANSATSASTSATTATTQATNASNSATSASTSATNASNSATAASTSATNAATSATNANSSFLSIDKKYLGSKASAPTLDNQGAALATGALYWNSTTNRLLMWTGSVWSDPETNAATSATNAATSATNAATSATNAANSATSASTSATTATTQATNASNSATSASTSATNAANSATSASTSATTATTQATNASSSFTSIDKKFLGSKTTNPTLDNQGAALATGAIYWNSTSNEMRVWTGSAWVATYVPAGSYVVGPTSVTDSTIALFDGTTGKLIKSSGTLLTSKAASGANTDITSLSGITGGISTVDNIDFDTAAVITDAIGRLKWNSGEGTLDLGLKGGSVNLQIGQESVVLCNNNTASTISNGSVVYITGSQGQRPTIALANANSEATSSKTLGIATESIAAAAEGYVTTEGIIRGLNTSGFAQGAALWLSTTAGVITTTRPVAPNHGVFIGYCINSHASAGTIFVKIQNGYELDELHDVKITSLTSGDLLQYNSTNSVWENKSITNAGIGGLSLANTWTNIQTFNGILKETQRTYVNAYTQTFYQSYVPNTYLISGEYQEICTITPSGSSQNFDILAEIYIQSASVVQIMNVTIGLRSDALPQLSWSGSWSESLVGGVSYMKPVLWVDTVTGKFKIALMHTSGTIMNISLKLDVINRGAYNVVVMNTTTTSDTTVIPTNFVQYDLLKLYTQTSISASSGSTTFYCDTYFNSTGAIKLPVGTDAQRPTAAQGMLRYNTTAGSFEGYNGTLWGSIGGIAYKVKTANYTAAKNDGLLADTSAGTFTITLPPTPATGDQVIIVDAKDTWNTNNLIVARNGSLIENVAEDITLDIKGISCTFIYNGTSWLINTQLGTYVQDSVRSGIGSVSVVSTNTAMSTNILYVITASCILTLPSTPSPGSTVYISNRSGTITSTIARNGSKIMGLSEDMIIDNINASFMLVYIDSTQGWVIL